MVTPPLQKDILAVSRIGAVPSILKLVSELTGMRVTMVARVTPDSWTACAAYDKMSFGLEVGTQLDVTTTLCKEVCDENKTVVIQHASLDPVYQHHRTPKHYNIESYIAIPILRPNGEMFGTLCAIDSRPANLEPKVVASLTLFTELISSQLRAEDDREEVMRALGDERRTSRLREEFIAVLGHDLRTPLGSIQNATDLLLEEGGFEPGQKETLEGMQQSTHQMGRLIADVLDFARGRLGGGMVLHPQKVPDVAPLIRRVVGELQNSYRDRTVNITAPFPVPAVIDEVRFHQLIANLAGNALQHSPPADPVDITLGSAAGLAKITIRNGGPPIPPELAADLFTPFQRAGHKGGKKREGLGLGLYISHEIARAHGGSLTADSGDRGTTFTLLLPSA